MRAVSHRRQITSRFIHTAAAATIGALGVVGSASAQVSTWVGPTTGNWGTAANWSNNAVPSIGTTVLIDASPANVTVNTGASTSRSANNLTLDAGDILQIDNSSTLTLAGNLTLNGTLRFNSNPNESFLNFSSATATISGAGVLDFNYQTGSPTAGVIQTTGAGALANQGTIRGGGTLRNIRFTNAAGGLLENYQTGAQLYLDANNGGAGLFVNQGTIRALAGTTVTFTGDNGGDFVSTGGNVQANGAGSIVRLFNGAAITGGNYSTTGGGEIVVEAGNTANASPESLSGTLRLRNGSTLNMSGTMNNNGLIVFSPNGNENFIRVGAAALTLNGTGGIQFDWTGTGPAGVIQADGAGTFTLGANQTVTGVGSFRNSRAINNGLIDANSGTAGLLNAGMYIDPSNQAGGPLFANNGTMRSSNGGLMVISGDNGGDLANANGTIAAIGDNSITRLRNAIGVTGGTYTSTGTGRIEVEASSSASIGGTTTLTTGSTLQVRNGSTLNLGGTMTNNGKLELVAAGNPPVLSLSSALALNGTGSLVGTYGGSGSGPRIDFGSNALALANGQTVSGVVHFNNARVTNNGLIDANQAAGMYVDPSNQSGGPHFTNNGTMRSSNGGLMVLTGDNGGDMINNGGIAAVGANSITEIYNNITVSGGSWTNSGGGVLRVRPGTTAGLTNPTFTAGSKFDVPSTSTNTAQLNASGAYVLDGTLDLITAGQSSILNLTGAVTLSGSGTIRGTYGGTGAGPRIDFGSNLLTIGANNKVEGVVHFNNARVTNNGLIDANQAAGMFVDPNNASGGPFFINNGTMRSSNGGLMVLAGDNGGGLTNNGGISAIGTNSITELSNNITVSGGSWTNSGGGVLRVRPGQTASVVDATIPAGSKFDVPTTPALATTLNASGAYTLDGVIELNAAGQSAALNLTGPVTLSGSGTIRGTYAGSGSGPRIDAPSNALTIGANNRVEGVIAFINGRVTNNGVIEANALPNMFIDPNNAGGGPFFINNGTMRATNGATMILAGDNGGNLGGTGPLIADANSIIQAQNNIGGDAGPVSGAGTYIATSGANLGHQNFRVTNLQATNSGRARVTAGGGTAGTSRVTNLTFNTGGKLDLADHDLIVDYDGASNITVVRGFLQGGYNGGPWNGTGIVSANATTTGFGIGYAEATSLFSSFPANFSGQTIDNTTVVTHLTRFGDANLSGTVDLLDFNKLAANFGQSNRVWFEGDFNYDGTVNLTDFNLLAGNFGLSAGPDGVVDPQDWASLAAAVPEPAIVSGLCSLMVALVRTRSRRIRD
jgi:hypothetical protein